MSQSILSLTNSKNLITQTQIIPLEFPNFEMPEQDLEALIESLASKPAAEFLVPFYKPERVLEESNSIEKFYSSLTGDKLDNSRLRLTNDCIGFAKLLYPEIKNIKDIETNHNINDTKNNLEKLNQVLSPDKDVNALPTTEITSDTPKATILAKEILKDLIKISQNLNDLCTFDDFLKLRTMVRSTYLKTMQMASEQMIFNDCETILCENRNNFKHSLDRFVNCFKNLNDLVALKKQLDQKELTKISNFLDNYTNFNPEKKQKYAQYFAFIVGSENDEMLSKEIEYEAQNHDSRSRKFPYDKPTKSSDEIAVLAQTMFTSPEILKVVEERRSLSYAGFLQALNDKEVIELVKFNTGENMFAYRIICKPELIRKSSSGHYRPEEGENFIIYSLVTDRRTSYTWGKESRKLVFEVDGMIENFLRQFLSAFKFNYYGEKVKINDSYISYGSIYKTFSTLGIELESYPNGYDFSIPDSENLKLDRKMSDSELTTKLVNWLLDRARKVEYTAKEITDGDLETKSEEFLF